MKCYIDKEAIEEELLKRIKKYATCPIGDKLEPLYGAKCHALNCIIEYINTLEVKESIEAIAMPSDGTLWVNREDLSNFDDGDKVNILVI